MKCLLQNFSKNEGYTFIEIFIVILIMGVISTVIYTNISTISVSVSQSRHNLAKYNDLLNLKIVLDQEIQNIKPPWFLKEYKFDLKDNYLEIFYYLGKKENSLLFEYSDECICIKYNESVIFESENLNGKFFLEDNKLYYIDNDRTLTFQLGVSFA